LDLLTAQNISDAVAKKGWPYMRRTTIVRLYCQAYAQIGVLSLADVSLLLGVNLNTVSRNILALEAETGASVPRRGTIHDMGPSVTHKAIICYKRLVERETTSEVAQETFHSANKVEYYVQYFGRVQLCHDQGMSKEDIARATAYSLPLIEQYLDLIKRFGLPFPMLPTTSGNDY
jgi:hypothetical protein